MADAFAALPQLVLEGYRAGVYDDDDVQNTLEESVFSSAGENASSQTRETDGSRELG